MKTLSYVQGLMLSLVLFFTFGATALAQDVDALVRTETEGGVTELLEGIQKRDAALAARDAALQKLEDVSKDMAARIRASELAAAALEEDVANKDALIEKLQVELTKTQESTRRDRLTLAYNLACIYKAGRQYTKAEAEFVKALALDPDDPGVHFNLGILYDDNLGDARKALVHYQRFLDLAPNDKDAPKVIEWMSSLH
jgi:tetratricopeptide (TPR) repeat protein